jgi:dihydroorotase
MVVDMKDERKIRSDELHSKCGWTNYEGFTGIFPSRVYSRGKLIIEDDSLCAKPGAGRNIRA